MSDQPRERGARAERYQRYQARVTGRKRDTPAGARPQEYDALGFPLPQRSSSFQERVARLLYPL
jgi:hypothetical protein